MNFASLSSNEKLAVYGSVAVVVGGIVGGLISALGWIAILAAIGMLAVVFLPQLSPQTNLPGSKGSLMLVCGAVAAIVAVLGLLTIISVLGVYLQFAALNAIFYLIAVAGAVVMAWAGWQEFQAEGGRFQLGAAAPRSGTPPATGAGTAGTTDTTGMGGTTGTTAGTGTPTTTGSGTGMGTGAGTGTGGAESGWSGTGTAGTGMGGTTGTTGGMGADTGGTAGTESGWSGTGGTAGTESGWSGTGTGGTAGTPTDEERRDRTTGST